jgi:putative phosphoribosyl transferase
MDGEFELNDLEKEVILDSDDVQMNGILALPKAAKAVIAFAHGSGSGRYSPRNNFVARVLQQAQLGTLLMDLLSEPEALDRSNVFNIELLSQRLRLAKTWLENKFKDPALKIGYFGASTGAGAALVAAAEDPHNIFAVVSRGGRPDLAGDYLSRVQAPTLLLIGGRDDVVIDLNRDAFQKLNCVKEIHIIPGATHLFEEAGTLEQVAEQARDWFTLHA